MDGEIRFGAVMMKKGPPGQVQSGWTLKRFVHAERAGVPDMNKDVSARMSPQEGEQLTLGVCLKIYLGEQ